MIYLEKQRRLIADGIAAARKWRDNRQPLPRINANCGRCDDTGMVLWFGRRNEGGRSGPCPRCQVSSAKNFLTQYWREEGLPVGPNRRTL